MHPYQASVRTQVRGHSQVIKTEVRALNAQNARWLLWAQFRCHCFQSASIQVNTRWAAWSTSAHHPSRRTAWLFSLGRLSKFATTSSIQI